MSKDFYNSTKILSMKDLDGEEPSIRIVCGNRTAGKTFNFMRLLLRRFTKKNQKFMLIVRNKLEMEGVAEAMFKPLAQQLEEFKGKILKSKPIAKGIYYDIFLDDEHCGYVVALNNVNQLKRVSGQFVDVENMFFDEFMSETGKYLNQEVHLLESLYISVARGHGEHIRNVQLFMCSNTISVLNPYFVTFGIHKRINSNTTFLRGNGWVLERTHNTSASTAIKSSSFARAFQDSKYLSYATDNTYLLDNDKFVEKMPIPPNSLPLFNITKGDKTIGVWETKECLYISEKHNKNLTLNVVFNLEDHNINYIMLQKTNNYVSYIKKCFEAGYIRFADIECKNIFIDFLGYTLNEKLKK